MNNRPTYAPADLKPVITGPFSVGHRRMAIRRQRLNERMGWAPSPAPLPDAFNAKDMVMPTAVAAIRKAFTLAKTSKDSWSAIQREGRFDVRRAPAVTRGAQDVFKRKVGTSTTKVRCAVMIDSSGSMQNAASGRIQNPAQPTDQVVTSAALASAVFGATIAEALGRVPTVDLDVYQHSAASNGKLFIKWRWHRGTPVAVFNAATTGLHGGGNADGHALYAVTEKMRRELRRGERGVILMVSDGLPSVMGRGNVAEAGLVAPKPGDPYSQHMARNKQITLVAGQALIDAVAHARKSGITVVAVAIDGSDQSAYYGADGFIPFDGNWTALGSALARRIGSALARR